MTNDTKPRIVIAQKHYLDLEEIKDGIKNDSRLEIHYTHDPEEALSLASEPVTRVLVSGLSFHGGDLTSFAIAREMGEGPEYMRRAFSKYGNLTDGNYLVHCAREANPELITIASSYLFQNPNIFCGRSEKMGFPVPLPELLTNQDFIESLNSKKKASLPKIKNVSWYLDNFPNSWK